MAKYKLLAGQHIGPDLKEKPAVAVHPVTGEKTTKYPSRTYTAGQIVESKDDLVAKHGSTKFQLVGSDPVEPSGPKQDAAVFPGGQVSSGLQGSTSTPDGRTVSGPVDDVKAGEGPRTASTLPKDADLDSKTVAELREIAEDEDIDLKGAHSKADILKAIRAK